MNKLCPAIFLLMSLNAFSQPTELNWVNRAGGQGDDMGHSVTGDSYGNIYSAGHFADTIDLDPSAAEYLLTGYGLYLQKLDAQGNLLWANSLNGGVFPWVTGLGSDSIGNLYVVGTAGSGYIDLDPDPINENIADGGFLAKYNTNGEFLWANQNSGQTLEIDQSGNLFIGGSGVSKFNDQGDLQWSALDANGSSIWVKAVSIDSDGNIYAAGKFAGTVDFDSGPGMSMHTSEGQNDAFIAKLNNVGELVWVSTVGGPSGSDRANGISVDDDGNSYVTGRFRESVDFDPGAGVDMHSSMGGTDGFVLKLTPSGTLDWVQTLGGWGTDVVNQIHIYGNATIIVVGAFEESVDFDAGVGTYFETSSGDSDVFMLKLASSSGAFQGVGVIHSLDEVTATSTYARAPNELVLTGMVVDTTDFDPKASEFIMTSINWEDGFVASYGIDGLASIQLPRSAPNYEVYPNPSTGVFIITSSLEVLDFIVLNSIGQIVDSKSHSTDK